MFAKFSENLYRLCVAREYGLVQSTAEKRTLTETAFWTVQKRENASLCLMHVVDCDRMITDERLTWIKAQRDTIAQYAETLLPDFHQITVLYVLVSASESLSSGKNDPTFDADAALHALMAEAESYMGQPLYHLYWRVCLRTREISAPEGQPSDIFGLRALLIKALEGVNAPPVEIAEPLHTPVASTFGDVERDTLAASPFKPLHRHAVLTYVLAVVSAAVTLLMYLDGYPGDNMTAARFGAIVPELIFQGGEYYRLFTAMFVHFGFIHLLMNLTGLFIFGTRVERYYGRVCFLGLYILSGLCGSVFSLFFTRGYAAGASGAIYGLVGAVYAYTRVSKRAMDWLTGYFLLLFIGVGLTMGFIMPGIDNFGHIGGLLAGTALGAGWMSVRRSLTTFRA